MGTELHRIASHLNGLRLRLFYLFSVKLNLSSKKRLLVIKNDSIGDYIISRNFLAEIKRSEKFKNYELYLMTSSKLAPIARELDGHLFTEIILSNTKLATADEQLKYFKLLRSYRFDYVLHPTYSPDSRTQYLVKFIAARHKIGFDGDTSNQTIHDKARFEPYYSQLISLTNKFSHEFEKNLVFFNAVLHQPASFTKPDLKPATQVEKNRQIVICPGAQHAYRIWSLQYFGELITRLNVMLPDHEFVVVTGPGEDALYTGIAAATAVKLQSFKIDSTLNLVALLAASYLVVCNDSSAAHIAVAGDVPSVCVSNGNHFKRFIPYPDHMKVKQRVVLPPTLLRDQEKGDADKYYAGSQLDINEISVDTVFEACKTYLNN